MDKCQGILWRWWWRLYSRTNTGLLLNAQKFACLAVLYVFLLTWIYNPKGARACDVHGWNLNPPFRNLHCGDMHWSLYWSSLRHRVLRCHYGLGEIFILTSTFNNIKYDRKRQQPRNFKHLAKQIANTNPIFLFQSRSNEWMSRTLLIQPANILTKTFKQTTKQKLFINIQHQRSHINKNTIWK